VITIERKKEAKRKKNDNIDIVNCINKVLRRKIGKKNEKRQREKADM